MYFGLSGIIMDSKGAEILPMKFCIMKRNTSDREGPKALRSLKGCAPCRPPLWLCGGVHFQPWASPRLLLFIEIFVPMENTPNFSCIFSEATTEVKVLFFFRRGQILLLHGRRRGEIDTDITINSPFAWGEVSSPSSTATSPSPSRSTSPPRSLCRSKPRSSLLNLVHICSWGF
jgi:hypothetical protein